MKTHCFFIHFSFGFFHDVSYLSVHPFVYVSPFSVTFLFLRFSCRTHISMMYEVTHGFFMRRCLPRISLAVSVTAVFIAVIIVYMPLFSFS